MYKILLILSGLIAISGSFAKTFTQLIIVSIAYMMTDGAHKAQQSIIMYNMIGETSFMEGWTMLLIVQSPMILMGPSVVGLITDLTHDYKIMFYFMGVPVIISSLILNFLSLVSNPAM